MVFKIRDWDKHFEADRSRQWKSLKWVPIPNKQGLGYKKIMAQKNGAEIFGCWNALIQQGSLCDPRGDLSKYSINDLSMNTMIPLNILTNAINYIVQNLDWIEVIENLDKNVNDLDVTAITPPVDSSMLCNSIQSNSIQEVTNKNNIIYIPEHLKEIWPHYLEMRKLIKKPATIRAQTGIIAALEKLAPKDNEKQIKIVQQSINNSWQGVFELKEERNGSNRKFGTGITEESRRLENKYGGL